MGSAFGNIDYEAILGSDFIKGYEPGNIQWISNRANTLKSDASLSELKRLTIAYAKIVGGEDLVTSAIPEGSKACTLCMRVKHLDSFHKRPDKKDHRHSQCKSCVNSQSKRKRNPLIREMQRASKTPPTVVLEQLYLF